MRIGVIQASSQANKNEMLFQAVRKYAAGWDAVNYGCRIREKETYSYIEVSLMAGLLLTSRTVDFIVTGCSSGQGMMLACNSFPGVLCGYAPSPMDAYLFAQINHGNAISLPLGEEYTWAGRENMEQTIQKLFSEPFGQGYPKQEADRKRTDTERLKEIRARSQTDAIVFLNSLDRRLMDRVLSKREVTADIISNGGSDSMKDWLRKRTES